MVLLVGWDTADWKIVSAMLDAGQLPHLARLVEHGTTGRLTAVVPLISASLWTSMVTGRRADCHKILTATEPDPDTGGTRPPSSTSRTCKALWNILTQNELRAHAVNWVASHPAEPISGACVSDRFATVAGPKGHEWPLPEGAIQPPGLAETLGQLRIHPADLDGGHLAPFVPGLSEVNQKLDRRLEVLATHLAEAASYHAAATYLLEHEPSEFLAVRYSAFDPLARHFLKLSQTDFPLYQHVMAGVYRFHDMMLGRLVQLAGPDATVIVASDHGFARQETSQLGYRANGFIVLSGPRVKRDELIHGATVLDVTPTILALLGLPAGEDHEGRPLLEALHETEIPARIPSWELAPGDAGQHHPGSGEETGLSAELIEQLASLGYLEESEEDRKTRKRLARQRTLNLAFTHLSANRPAAAIPLLETLRAEDPEDVIPSLHLAHCYLLTGRHGDCRRMIEDVLAHRADHPSAYLIRGNLDLAEARHDAAVEALLNAEENKAKRPGLELLIGQCYLRLGQGKFAERAYRTVLARDEDIASAHYGLALSLLLQARTAEAADEALTAVGLDYHFPEAHRALGVALSGIGRRDAAAQAFRTCLALDPSDTLARNALNRMSLALAP
jgi:Flp pilus assembly protein TadD